MNNYPKVVLIAKRINGQPWQVIWRKGETNAN
jgi:hypothetical protein